MDSLTHTLFGITQYGALNKEKDTKEMKRALLLSTIVGSQIPDIDVISKLWDTEGMYQMWHRGITHSLFLVPVWAILLTALCVWLFKVRDYKRLFSVSFIAVFIHSTSDLFNAWGTGYFEPFSPMRVTFGTIPIIDFVYWGIMVSALIISRIVKLKKYRVFRYAWVLIVVHVIVQSGQGYTIYQQYEKQYDQIALSASFVPWNFTVIGKKEDVVELTDVALFKEPTLLYTLHSSEEADINRLFTEVPEARTLYEWSPFVVIVDDNEVLGVYDPRFYRNGQSFLFEFIEKESE